MRRRALGSAGRRPGATIVYEQDLSNFEDWLRRLKVEYDVFFNGSRKRPPEDLRARVEKLVKKLSQASNMTFSERFQFNTLVARFYLYRDLWRRTTTRQELGIDREQQAIPSKNQGATARTPGEESQVTIRIGDPETEHDKIRELYLALMRLGGEEALEKPRITYQQFETYVAHQTKSIRDKYKCSTVVFTLSVEEKAVKFRALAAN
jgi:hypothetical protein